MGFWVAESDTDGSIDLNTARLLQPGPTKVEYGDRFVYSIQETHGSGVQQRFRLKSREMKWVWEKYNTSVPRYDDLYWYLFSLQSHILVENDKSPYVWIKDEETTNFGKYNFQTNRIDAAWIRVLVTYVGRGDPDAGGNVRFPTTEFRFVLSDDSITEIW